MATGQLPGAPHVRRADMMREAWHPVGRHLGRGWNGGQEFLLANPPLVQGLYYVLTGLWPWLSMHTFLMVTGEKTDLWLVKTVGALIVVIGFSLCLVDWLHEDSWATFFLAIASALALASVDVLFVAGHRIPPIYLLDAVVEGGLIALWLGAWWTGRHRPARRPGSAPVAQMVNLPGGPVAR